MHEQSARSSQFGIIISAIGTVAAGNGEQWNDSILVHLRSLLLLLAMPAAIGTIYQFFARPWRWWTESEQPLQPVVTDDHDADTDTAVDTAQPQPPAAAAVTDVNQFYQLQWLSSPMTEAAIQSCLTHVTNVQWQLHQCATRTSVHTEVQRSLLSFGLEHCPADTLLGAVYRAYFLRALMRLDTYEALMRIAPTAPSQLCLFPLSSLTFANFLRCDLVSAAKDLAQDEQLEAMEQIVRRHKQECGREIVMILGEIPVTTQPKRFLHLLPLSTAPIDTAADTDSADTEWERALDVATSMMRSSPDEAAELPARVHRIFDWLQRRSSAIQLPSPVQVRTAVSQCCVSRIRLIDAMTGDLTHIRMLCQLVVERDPHLRSVVEPYRAASEQVSELVYQYHIDVSLSEWIDMSASQRLHRVLARSTAASIASDLLGAAQLVLQDTDDEDALIREFIRAVAPTDIARVRAIARASKTELMRWLPRNSELRDVLIEAIYSHTGTSEETWDTMEEIIDDTPVTAVDSERVSEIRSQIRAARILARHHLKPRLTHLVALARSASVSECETMFSQLCRRALRARPPLSERQWSAMLSDMLQVRDAVFSFLPLADLYILYTQALLEGCQFRLAKRTLRILTGLEPADTRSSDSMALTLAAATQPRTGVAHSDVLPLSSAESLVLKVCRELLDSASSLDHEAVQWADQCLRTLPLQSHSNSALSAAIGAVLSRDTEYASQSSLTALSSAELTSQWQAELEFIDGLTQLRAMGVDAVPYALRASSLAFLDAVIAANPAAYLEESRLMDLALLFGCVSDECQAEGRITLIEAALNVGDVEAAYTMCLTLLEKRRYRPAHRVAARLQQSMSSMAGNRAQRSTLAAHATWACGIDELPGALHQWKRVSDMYDSGWENDDVTLDLAATVRAAFETDTPVDLVRAPSLATERALLQSASQARESALVPLLAASCRTDAELAISYALELSRPEHTRELFRSFSASADPLDRAAVLDTATQFFARRARVEAAQDSSTIAELLTEGDPHTEPLSLSNNFYSAAARQFASEQTSLAHTRLVQRLVPDVQTARFEADVDYRQRILSELACAVQRDRAESLDVAVDIARASTLPVAPIYVARVTALLLSSIPVDAVTQELDSYQHAMLEDPRALYQSIILTVIPHIDGYDLPRLRCAFTVADRCLASLAPHLPVRSLLSTHLRVLETLSKANLRIDYHRLTQSDTASAELERAVDESNVLLVARLANRINEMTQQPSLALAPTPSLSLSPSVTVSSSLVFYLFLRQSLTTSLASPSFSADQWLDRQINNFSRLSLDHAQQLIAWIQQQSASVQPGEIARLVKVLEKYARVNQESMRANTSSPTGSSTQRVIGRSQ